LNTNVVQSSNQNNETCEEPLISNNNSSQNVQKRILIVDDQQFNIEAIIIILKYGLGIDAENICDYCFNGK